jgi:hypothetical protein
MNFYRKFSSFTPFKERWDKQELCKKIENFSKSLGQAKEYLKRRINFLSNLLFWIQYFVDIFKLIHSFMHKFVVVMYTAARWYIIFIYFHSLL